MSASDHIVQIGHTASGVAMYRRSHIKSDGREVLLYGHAPPDAPPTADGLDITHGVSELRWHPLRQEWNVYAAARQHRTYKPSAAKNPLCPTPPGGPVTEIPFADFELAVFANRFPSFQQHAILGESTAPHIQRATAVGHCDVVVFSPEPNGSLATLGQDRRRLLIHAWIDRYKSLFERGFDYVLPFENRGEEVGVTLHHPHGQIYAFGFVPHVQAQAIDAFAAGFDLAGRLRDWTDEYAIAEAGGIVAFAPPFARFPYEVWLAPGIQRAGPWDFTDEEIDGFAMLLGEINRRYDVYFGRACPYMLSLHAAPRAGAENFHFTAQYYPLLRAADRIKYLASVEQSTGVFTVDIMPEHTAQKLRS